MKKMPSLKGNPFLIYSVPVMLIMGVFWFKRRNKSRGGVEENDENHDEEFIVSSTNDNQEKVANICLKSKSLDINRSGNITSLDVNSNSDNISVNSVPTMLSRSDPIDIVPKGRHSSHSDPYSNRFDDHNTLNGYSLDIDERFNLNGSCDLPGSYNDCRDKKSVSIMIPVETATTTSPKILQEQRSFIEQLADLKQDQAKFAAEEQEEEEILEIAEEVFEEAVVKNEENECNESKTEEDCTSSSTEFDSEENENENIVPVEEEEEERESQMNSNSPVRSLDSGKGASLPRADSREIPTTFEFYLPTSLIGKLYGCKRNFLTRIKTESNVKVRMKKHPISDAINVCVVEGTNGAIDKAMKMVRYKLPTKQYPNLTLQRIHFAEPQAIVQLSKDHFVGLEVRFWTIGGLQGVFID